MNKLKEINGKYYQECEVLMLATDDKAAPILSYLNNESLQYFPNTYWSNSGLTKRHLYFLSNEEIKEGDYVIDSMGELFGPYEKGDIIGKEAKKITAATDIPLQLPQPSKSFIQAYIKAYNEGKPITKVLVEMEEYATKTTYYSDIDCSIPLFRLKVNSSNEITIKNIKDSYTREEIIALFEKARVDIMDMTFDGDFPECYVSKEELFEWIEENL